MDDLDTLKGLFDSAGIAYEVQAVHPITILRLLNGEEFEFYFTPSSFYGVLNSR